jgi:aspartyl-tRNA(Asn)/glutamyl-tRNA(Gln) amidotransferase subunit A
MDLPLHQLPATQLLSLYAERKLSPVEAVRAVLSEIDRLNPKLNAYCFVDPDSALAAARASEMRWMRAEPKGLLDGIPTSVKDLVLVKDWPTLRGSKLVDPRQPWDQDAIMVGQLRQAGAIFLGKTTTPEFGWKGVTDSPLNGITRNPWNPELTPGGSSGGAAVAAACGMGALHIGTDGGGSIRIPASFTGVVGFKPTYGIVPRHPPSPYGTLSTGGPITRTVADAALMMEVLAQPCDFDFYGVPFEPRPFRDLLGGGVAGWRIAYAPTLSGARVDPEIARIVAAATQRFAALGAQVIEVPRVMRDSLSVFQRHWFAGAASLVRHLSPGERRKLDRNLAKVARAGAKIPVVDFLSAVREREEIGSQMMLFFRDWDLLLTPTMPVPAFAVGSDFPPHTDRGQWTDWTPFSYPFNLTRQPAISVPCGFTASGLPVGLQIVGPMLGDHRVLRAAKAFEETQPLRLPAL